MNTYIFKNRTLLKLQAGTPGATCEIVAGIGLRNYLGH